MAIFGVYAVNPYSGVLTRYKGNLPGVKLFALRVVANSGFTKLIGGRTIEDIHSDSAEVLELLYSFKTCKPKTSLIIDGVTTPVHRSFVEHGGKKYVLVIK